MNREQGPLAFASRSLLPSAWKVYHECQPLKEQQGGWPSRAVPAPVCQGSGDSVPRIYGLSKRPGNMLHLRPGKCLKTGVLAYIMCDGDYGSLPRDRLGLAACSANAMTPMRIRRTAFVCASLSVPLRSESIRASSSP